MKALKPTRLLPTFDYVPTAGCEPSHRHTTAGSLRQSAEGDHVTVPTMVFDDREGPHFCLPHIDPLVVELKVANALIRRILINTVSFVDIITWNYCRDSSIREQKSLPSYTHPRLWRTRGKPHKNDPTPTTVRRQVQSMKCVILERLTLHKVKVVIASYLLQLQYEADDDSIRKLQGDQRTA
ncbi:hypothetical protein Cgig2_025069 [Carnegiea gigantea]|uniref:Uncharacterized protein n=1 Tax=Carnegiea gigantea TaxID=171969 RepID=A0A9Q1Q4X6_9CARY|nr:hypothetical protein Cgig2_025069 [Carnegiea gigantea]